MLNPFEKYKAMNKESRIRAIELKLLDLGKLRNLIYRIYGRKFKVDQDRKARRDFRQPMCQFVYEFFVDGHEKNNKAVNELYNFITSVKVNCVDSEIALFAMILRNEIEEEFALIFYQIKERISDLKSLKAGESESRYDEEQDRVSWSLAMEIIDDMYGESHPNKAQIMQKIQKLFDGEKRKKKLSRSMKSNPKKPKSKLGPKGARAKRPVSTEEFIYFYDLEKTILNQELKSHRIYLKALRIEFLKLDSENLGAIATNCFQELINNLFWNQRVKPYAVNFLKKRKEYSPESLAFSDVVLFFSEEQSNSDFKNVLEIINENYFVTG